MYIPTRRDISTTGTITAMSKTDLVFLFFLLLSEQYVSLLFEHTGLPTNLVTQLNAYIRKSAQKITVLYKVMIITCLYFLPQLTCSSKELYPQMNKLHAF
jgi:hypothetical protein